MPGTPILPHECFVCITTATLSLPCVDPRRPNVRCNHWEVSPRTRLSRGHTGMPPCVGNKRRRIRVPSITSHICVKEGCREEHLAKKERTVVSSLRICAAHRPSGSPSGPVKENHTPRYLTASVGGAVVVVCSLRTPSLSSATKVSG